MTIKELLAEPQYECIVFFLSEHGYIYPHDLVGFDFDELFFVPGVTDEIFEKSKRILVEHIDDNGTENLPLSQETVKEFDDSIEQLETVVSSTEASEKTVVVPDQSIHNSSQIEDIDRSQLLSSISVKEAFENVPRSSAFLRFCREYGIENLFDLEQIDFSLIHVKGLGPSTILKIKEVFENKREAVLSGEIMIPKLQKTVYEWFDEVFSSFKERDLGCLLARSQGWTLQATGDLFGITRERVRQITAKAVRMLQAPCKAIVHTLAENRQFITTADIKAKFNEQNQIDVISFVLKNSEFVVYFSFADKYVLSIVVPENWERRLSKIAVEIIGDSINYYDSLDVIDEQLSHYGVSFLDSMDYFGYLLENRYKALGDFVVKKAQAYRNICLSVIRRHFPNGIKLDMYEDNVDMAKLRSIVRKEFGDVKLPDNNRALMARVTPALILCGRGRYISPENSDFDISIIEQIVDYINGRSETSLYYSEIFTAFSGVLLAQTGIDNFNYLHGVLKYLYPDDFTFERDLMVKKGMKREDFDTRLEQLIKDHHRPVSRTEIQDRILGVTDIRITNSLIRIPKLIQWDYNEFNHIDNLCLNPEDIEKISTILCELTGEQKGYCSENKLFDVVSNKMPEFISRNAIQNSHNLFYIISYLFRNKYRFSRPHIASEEFPNIELTNANIAKVFTQQSERLFYPDLVEMGRRAGWSSGTLTMVINAVENDYCKVGLNDYILRKSFHIDVAAQEKISQAVSDLLSESGYYGIFAIYNYDTFPSVPYEWNEFLLQTVLEEYDLGFKILEPNTKDRRFKRGIIVSKSCECNSFEDFVIEQMKSDSVKTILEADFSSYLRRKGLVLTTSIPQEFYGGDGVRFENGSFVYD